MLPGDGLRSVTVVKVKVDDSGVCESMVEDSMHDSNVNIVDPAESRRV
jgi:hypothetical protein